MYIVSQYTIKLQHTHITQIHSKLTVAVPALAVKPIASGIGDTRASSSSWPAVWQPFAFVSVARRLQRRPLVSLHVRPAMCREPHDCLGFE